MWEINVLGVANSSAAALPHLRRSSRAAIVNVCSIAALNGVPNRALYSATKGAVYSLTLAMAMDHLAEGVRVNAVNPGTVDGPFIDRIVEQSSDPAGLRRALAARQPSGRMVAPEEVAAAILFLASPASPSTVGAVLDVDGGYTRLRPPRA